MVSTLINSKIISMVINISSNAIENWFEERLALDQEHKVNPEKRMVRIKTNYLSSIVDHLVYLRN